MKVRLLAIIVPVLWAWQGTPAEPMDLELQTDRARYYGGTTILVEVLHAQPDLAYRWQTSVRGAVVERDTARAGDDEVLSIALKTPEVERIATLKLQVEALSDEAVVARKEEAFLLFPPYQPRRGRKTGVIGAAASDQALCEFLDKADIGYYRISSRMSLHLFEGNILLSTGEWIEGEGKILIPLIEAKVRQGLRLAVVEPRRDWRFFPFAGRVEKMPLHPSCLILHPDHPALQGLWYLSDCRGLELVPSEHAGPGITCNLRILAEEAHTRLPLVVEVFPPGDGLLLFVALPIVSNLERDPAAPLLLEQCVRYLDRPAVPSWREVLVSGEHSEAVADRLHRLGVQVPHPLPADLRSWLLVESYESLAADQRGSRQVELPRHLQDWVQDGNEALILVGGAPKEKSELRAKDPVTKGISPGLLEQLLSGQPETAGELPDFGLEDKYHVLISGLVARIDLGRGEVYVLRDGYEKAHAGRDEISPAWAEFLSIVLTNLGVRIEGNLLR